MGVRKRDGWEKRLYFYIKENEKRTFDWVLFNCGTATIGAVEVMNNGPLPIDEIFQKDYRGALKKYGSREGCLVAAMEQMGKHEIPITRATIGDVVYLETESYRSIGFVDINGSFVRFPRQPSGWAKVRLSEIKNSPGYFCRVWRV